MTIDKIYYQRNFRIGEFLYENIGIGIAINEGEDAKQALDEAKNLVEKYHWENVNQSLAHQTEEPLRDIQVHEPAPKTTSLVDDIKSCTEVKVLESYKLLVKNNAALRQVYNEKLEELTKQSKSTI